MTASPKEPRLRVQQSNCSGHSAGAMPAFIMRHSARAGPRAASRCVSAVLPKRLWAALQKLNPAPIARRSARCRRRNRARPFGDAAGGRQRRDLPPAQGWRVRPGAWGRMASASPKSPVSSTGATRERTTFCSRSRSGFRANSTGAAPIWSAFVNGIAAAADRTQGPGRERQGRLRQQHPQLSLRHSASLRLQRRRHRLERYGDEGRRDLCAVRAFHRMEEGRERGRAAGGRPRGRHSRHRRPGAAARPSRELRRLRKGQGRAHQEARQKPPISRRQPGGRSRRPHRRDARQARRVLAYAGLRQEPLDALFRAEDSAHEARQLDLRDRHRPGSSWTTRSRRLSPRAER